MKFLKCLLTPLLVIFTCQYMPVQYAHAEWSTVGNLAQPLGVVTLNRCSYRFCTIQYANPAVVERCFAMTESAQFRSDSGAVTSQILYFDGNFHSFLTMASAGFAYSWQVPDIVALYQGPEKPFSEHFAVILGNPYPMVSLGYAFFNQSQNGAIYNSTRSLKPEKFVLQKDCASTRPTKG